MKLFVVALILFSIVAPLHGEMYICCDGHDGFKICSSPEPTLDAQVWDLNPRLAICNRLHEQDHLDKLPKLCPTACVDKPKGYKKLTQFLTKKELVTLECQAYSREIQCLKGTNIGIPMQIQVIINQLEAHATKVYGCDFTQRDGVPHGSQ